MRSILFYRASLYFYLFVIFSCFTTSNQISENQERAATQKLRRNIIRTALQFEGKPLFSREKVFDRTFTLDCSGTVAAIFYQNGIDLLVNGGGVKNIYQTLKQSKLIYHDHPRAGDLVFWDNTHDANNDLLFGNDPLTHVGLIVQVDQDETISFLHANYYTQSLTVDKMNLIHPHLYKNEAGEIINHVLFSPLSRTKNTPLCFAGQLYRDSGNAIDKKIEK